jgi:folate-binding protein YgfZ
VQVAARRDGFLLLQDGDQPEPVDRILDPYVLSSDVELDDVSGRLGAFAVLGGFAAEDGDAAWTPSPLELGAGLVAATGEPARRLRAGLLADGLTEVFPAALERWRIRRGLPRMGMDFGTDALPAEAGLEAAIDFTKGCFLGQESVAKVRNLGHPPRAILPVRAEGALRVGMPVEADGATVGQVTSVADDDLTLAIVRVRWHVAGSRLGTTSGPLSLR